MKKFAFGYCLWLLCCAGTVFAEGEVKVAVLQQRVDHLEAQVRASEAIRAIKRLQYAYGHYAELGLWHDLADLFAENGVGHYPAGILGKEAIRRLFLQEVGKGKLGLGEGQFYPHIMLQPVVTLDPDGTTARGRWRVFAMLGSYGGAAVWAGGVYENEYILKHGNWTIKDLHYYSQYTGRYDQPGWTTDKGEIPIHYDPMRAGKPVPENLRVPALREAKPSLSKLAKRLAGLTQRALLLHDAQEVENLQRIYGYYVDRKMWDDVADLFTLDGTMELGLQGVYAGKRSIRRALNQFGASGLREGELNDHLQLQVVVDVAADGRTAKARGVELIMSGINGAGGEWGEGIFENEFIKQDGAWKINLLHFYPRLYTDYYKGWGIDAKTAPGPSKAFPPDRPPTEVYEIFPKFFIPPFHFVNPVTGRPTRYPKECKPLSKGVSSKRKPDFPPAARTTGELESRIAETERILKTVLAYDAAENLASAYGYYLDDFRWDDTADLFSSDAKRDLSSISVDVGRERIRESLKRRYPGKKSAEYLLAHQLVQPVIHVATDGLSAKMRVRLFQLAGPSSGNGSWIAGIYECKTGIEDGTWKFTAMDLDYIWTADYRRGWAHIPPDTKGIVTAPFPKIIDLPFHYANPVTGRKPPVFVP